jgi:nicotinamide-nucleotide amidase
MNAEIITIGDELLIGQVVDTNSAWIANQLNNLGFAVERIVSVSDTEQAISESVIEAIGRYDLTLVTGGLGPTSDDVTKETLRTIFGGEMVTDYQSLELIDKFCSKRGMAVTDTNRKQAEVPSSCTVLPNYFGTAPGMLFKKGTHMLVSLPGVPFEMKALFENSVTPLLNQLQADGVIIHKVIHTFGIAESNLSDLLNEFEKSIPPSIKLAYLPDPSGIRLRLSAYGYDRKLLSQQVDEAVEKLRTTIPQYIFGYGDTSLPDVVGKMLLSSGATVSVAESCTGGNISHLIVEIPGASNYFSGGIVAYSNQVKENLLGVKHQTLIKYGAVSREVVEEMAVGSLNLLSTDYSIAVSGIAGPDGGTSDKPVGLVWIAVASVNSLEVEKYIFSNNRSINIQRASYSALNMLRKLLLKEHAALKNIF